MSEADKQRLSIHWNKSENNIRDTDADVLLILDCCDSGTLTRRGSAHSRKFELLAACGHDKTTCFPGKHSFTSALIWALQELAKENPSSPFSTCKLRLKIAEEAPNYAEMGEQNPLLFPRDPSSNRSVSDEHIMIEILKQHDDSQEVLGISRQEGIQVGDYADFRFHFTGPFGEVELRKAAREMMRVIKNKELPLRSIGYLEKGNLLRQFALPWLERARRKSSAGPPTPVTPTMLEVPRPDLHGTAPPNFDLANVVTSQPHRLSVSTLNDEASPLLSTKSGNMFQPHPHSGVRYHLRELLKIFWTYCYSWLGKSKSTVSTVNVAKWVRH